MKKIILENNINLIMSKACVEDAEGIIDFLNKVGGETDYITFGLGEFPFSLQEEKKLIAECVETGNCLMLVGKINGEIVSQLFLDRTSRPRLLHAGNVGITVSKPYWGKSIGKHMLLFALAWAESAEITKLQLEVRTDNERAIQLYKKLGFNIEGTITRALKIHDVYFDSYIMGLEMPLGCCLCLRDE